MVSATAQRHRQGAALRRNARGAVLHEHRISSVEPPERTASSKSAPGQLPATSGAGAGGEAATRVLGGPACQGHGREFIEALRNNHRAESLEANLASPHPNGVRGAGALRGRLRRRGVPSWRLRVRARRAGPGHVGWLHGRLRGAEERTSALSLTDQPGSGTQGSCSAQVGALCARAPGRGCARWRARRARAPP